MGGPGSGRYPRGSKGMSDSDFKKLLRKTEESTNQMKAFEEYTKKHKFFLEGSNIERQHQNARMMFLRGNR